MLLSQYWLFCALQIKHALIRKYCHLNDLEPLGSVRLLCLSQKYSATLLAG